MDIQHYNFPSELLGILTAISESHFVAIDLELSGVPVRPPGVRDRGKQTLQQRYTETKIAADKYQILQIGLTCVKENPYDGAYELKPYNIDISPVLEERLDISRDFSFHTGAVEFLNSVGFDYQIPLSAGVQYLSREEAARAEQLAKDRLSRTNQDYEPLEVGPDEVETLALLEKVKEAVHVWRATDDPDPEPLYLGSKELGRDKHGGGQLTRYEKRLIHQVIRENFAGLVTVPQRDKIMVVELDHEHEDRLRRQKLKAVQERIHRQSGFRWVIEALAGGSLKDIDPVWFTIDPETGENTPMNFDIKSRFSRAQHRIHGKPTAVVGHNMFLDLVYLYRTFIGPLPDSVEEFAGLMHGLFPVIVDTKYLATHECGDINPMSSLQGIGAELDKQERPVLATHQAYSKYDDQDIDHEAGFDSLVTARVAIRLSTKLEAGRREGESNDEIAAKMGNEGTEDKAEAQQQQQREVNGTADHSSWAANEVKSKVIEPVIGAVKAASRFAHVTAFDSLRLEEQGDGATDREMVSFDDLPGDNNATISTTARAWDDDEEPAPPQETIARQPWKAFHVMPPWESAFWAEYGNRLRVFGTREGLCVLAESAGVEQGEETRPAAA